jgi:hypothetical protein
MSTSFPALTPNFHSDAMLDTYVAESSVHAHFETNYSVTGGPPALLQFKMFRFPFFQAEIELPLVEETITTIK